MKNFFQNIRNSVNNLVNDVKQRTSDFVENYVQSRTKLREDFKEFVSSACGKVKTAFSSAVHAVADSNARYEYAMARPLDIATPDNYGSFASIIKNEKLPDKSKVVITRSDVTNERDDSVLHIDIDTSASSSELSLQ